MEFERLLDQSIILENLVLTGLRGVGKTSVWGYCLSSASAAAGLALSILDSAPESAPDFPLEVLALA